jgi:hypothetical protein
MNKPLHRLGAIACLLALHACGGGASDAGTPATTPPLTNAERSLAVTRTIDSNAFCSTSQVGDFYWEIGNKSGPQGSGSRGSTWSADTQMNIASASKWVLGAYVVEKLRPTVSSPLSSAVVNGLRMHAGYVSQDDAVAACSSPGGSLNGCFTAANATGSNATLTPSAVGKFYYANGNAQQLMAALGQGASTAGLTAATSSFGTEVRAVLQINSTAFNDFNYLVPVVSGGMRATPAQYAGFLRRLITDDGTQYQLKPLLGSQAVCTNPAGNCANGALSSPVPEDWQYSLHHWVEGDGSFTSPGRNGFYPWAQRDANGNFTYGVFARQQAQSDQPGSADYDPSFVRTNIRTYAYWRSVECGRKIRAAWMSGTVQ